MSDNENIIQGKMAQYLLKKALRNGTLLLAVFVIAGCATIPPPTQEMSDARQSVEAAKSAGAEELAPQAIDNAQHLLSDAESGMRTGDFNEAQQDAIAAREAAGHALAISQAKIEIDKDAAPALTKPESVRVTSNKPGHFSYTVIQGDSLWQIASNSSIYNDAYRWPLIYKTNSKNIIDADLIFPGQQLNISLDDSKADIDAAVRHAHQRGPWRIGATESSDKAYLRQYNLP